MLGNRTPWRRNLLTVALIACLPLAEAFAQTEGPWVLVGTSITTDGGGDTVAVHFHEIGLAMGVLRTTHSHDYVTAQGGHWRTEYLTAAANCGDRTLSPIRNDYYAADGRFVAVLDGRGLVLTEGLIARMSTWLSLYNALCTIKPAG